MAFDVGSSIGSLIPNFSGRSILIFGIIIAIMVLLACVIGFFVLRNWQKKNYNISIRVFKLVGGKEKQVGIFCARNISFSRAGDSMWRITNLGMNKTKAIKWIFPARIQTGSNEFWFHIREDGEFINFEIPDIDDLSKKANIKFDSTDLKAQRLAGDKILEDMFKNDKTFMEKYGVLLGGIILFLVIAVGVAIIMYQVSGVMDKITPLVSSLTNSMKIIEHTCQINQSAVAQLQFVNGGTSLPV